MDLETEKQEIIKQLIEVEDSSLLSEIRQLLHYHQNDFSYTIGQEEKSSIMRGIAQAEEGKGTEHEKMKTQHSKWLGR